MLLYVQNCLYCEFSTKEGIFLNLLIVDDEKFSVEALQNTVPWAELGIHHVFSCYNIQDAKELLENETINIMICDIEMPSGSGLDLLAWVEQESLPLVSILLTCHPDFSYAVTALEHKALAYLLKPFKPEELYGTIRQAIAKVQEIQRIARLQKREALSNASRTLVQEQFWFQLITGMFQDCDRSYVAWECSWKNIDFPEDVLFYPVLFLITKNQADGMNRSLVNFTIKNVLSEVLLSSENCPPPVTLFSYYVVLIPASALLSEKEMKEKYEHVVDFLHRNYHLLLQYFCGKAVPWDMLYEQVSSLRMQADTLLASLEHSCDSQKENVSVIEQSILLIRENPDISREELASRFFLNPDYFAKLFKKETGKALSDYIADLKLEEAKYMLSQTADGISNIASLLGYSNFSYFSKMFRKKTGMTPSEYRKAYYGTISS